MASDRSIFSASMAFCSTPLPVQVKQRHTSFRLGRCSSHPRKEQPHFSRRQILSALATFAATSTMGSMSPVYAGKAKEEEIQNQGGPSTGFLSKSGLKYFDFTQGEGPTPKWGQMLNIQYVSYTISASGETLERHDSSEKSSKDGYLIHHGNGEQIWGLEEALHSMSVGGRRRAIMPSSIAYISRDLGPIPTSDKRRREFSNALKEGDGTVVMDIELRRIWDDPDDRGYYDDLTPSNEQIIKIWKDIQSSSE